MPSSRKIASGVRDNYIGFINDLGHFIGGTPNDPAIGTASGMMELLGIKSVGFGVPDPDTVSITGDDTELGEFDHDSVTARAYICELAVHNLWLDAYLQGTTVDALAGGDWGALDITNAPERNVCVIHQGRAKKYDPDNTGLKAYEGILIPLATAKPLGRAQMKEREGAVYRLRITPQVAVRDPWGATYGASNTGVTALRVRSFRSDYPYHMVAFRGNGSLANVPLDYEPAGTAYARAWGSVSGGARASELTISGMSGVGVTPRQATLSPAPASGTYNSILYQYLRK